MFNTPILFLVFNRPDTTVRVFEQIRKIKPAYLYVATDGPRSTKPGESETCEQVRNLVLNGIDWDCKLVTLFREQNLGCGTAVSEAITWFFEQVEEGIILEDDCLPDESFFRFCEVQLNRYRENDQIKIISGNNFQNKIIRGDGSYYFSNYVHIWGWATWKRSWNLYDFDLKDWMTRSEMERKILFSNDQEYEYWAAIFESVSKKEVDTWDYQVFYLSLKTKGLNIIPNKNLVSNIGFSESSTHTKNPNHKLANLKTYAYNQDIIPSKCGVDIAADGFTFKNVYTDPSIQPNLVKFSSALGLKMLKRGFQIVNRKIEKEMTEKDMAFTGERLTTGIFEYWSIEHLHRYAVAMGFVEGTRVVDIASGEGYGSYLMANLSLQVIGVDISEAAVKHASEKYKKSNLSFKTGSTSSIPVADSSVDIVVSFETIEHHDEHDAMMKEIKRVLVPNGKLIISCPDKKYYSDVPGYKNPFHVKELYANEFGQLMKQYFSNTVFFTQKTIFGSVISLDSNQPSSLVEFSGNYSGIKKNASLQECPYLICVASDNSLNDIPFNASVFANNEVLASHIKLKEENISLEKSNKLLQQKLKSPVQIIKRMISLPLIVLRNITGNK